MDIAQLEQEIRDYPGQMRAAMLHEAECDEVVTKLRNEIDEMEAGPVLGEDKKLVKLQNEMLKLRQSKHAAILKDPKAFNLNASSATGKKIEILLSQDPDLHDLQTRIETRMEELQAAADGAIRPHQLDAKRAELEKAVAAAREAEVAKEVLQQAIPISLDLLVRLAQVQA
jgi:hypothetical protein